MCKTHRVAQSKAPYKTETGLDAYQACRLLPVPRVRLDDTSIQRVKVTSVGMEGMHDLLHCVRRLLHYCCWRCPACCSAAAQPHYALHEAQDVLVVPAVGLVAREHALEVKQQQQQAVSSV